MARTGNMREKIRSLMMKSADGGATEAERTEALLLAQKMMLRHGVSEEELKMLDASEDAHNFVKKKEAYEKPITNYGRLKFYEHRLAMVIAPNFRCYTYHQKWNGKKRLIFLGIKEDTEIACDVYEFACKAVEYLGAQHLEERDIKDRSKRIKIKNDYTLGFIKGLDDKFKAQVTENEFHLVLVKDALVEQVYEKLDLTKGGKFNIGSMNDPVATLAGYRDGKNLNYDAKRIQ